MKPITPKIKTFLQKNQLYVEAWNIKSIIVALTSFLAVVVAAVSLTMYAYKVVWLKEELQEGYYAGVASVELIVILGLCCVIFFFVKQKPHQYATFPAATHRVNHLIRDAVCEAQNINDKDHLRDLEKRTIKEILDEVREVMEKITNVPCRVAFSAIIREQDNNSHTKSAEDYQVRLQWRDTRSRSKYNEKDKEFDNKKNKTNYIRENTSYYTVISGVVPSIFFCNDLYLLWADKKYKSTSFQKYGGEPTALAKRKSWNLPCMSKVVAPVWYEPDKNPDSITQGTRFYGFLRMDTEFAYAFDPVHIYDIIGTFSDALCTLLSVMEDRHIQIEPQQPQHIQNDLKQKHH